MPEIKLSKPYLTQAAIDRLVGVLESGWLTQGPLVAEFEKTFSNYVGLEFALAVNSATSGLHIALMSLGVGPGDEVIVPAFTWVATANAVELCGATAIFVDIDAKTLNSDIEQILCRITSKTKAIIVVHLFGKPFDIAQLQARISKNISIVEDAACAAGAMVGNQKCGTMGEIGVYSFHPRKSITTGEGGMVVTNNRELYSKMNMLRNHGQDTATKDEMPDYMYDCPVVGLNYRMTDIQAALGVEQLIIIDDLILYRNQLAEQYNTRLKTVPQMQVPQQKQNERHSWQSYVISFLDPNLRNEIMLGLKKFGIETRPGTHAVHTLKYYREKYQYTNEDLPMAYRALHSTMALPLHNHMTSDDVDYVADKLIEVIDAYS